MKLKKIINKIKLLLAEDKYSVKENYITGHANVEWWESHLNQVIIQESIDQMGDHIADFGCNHGANTILMAKMKPNAKFQAFDLNEDALNVARDLAKQHNASNISFHHERLDELKSIEDNTFSGAYMIDVIEHIYPKDRDLVLKEFQRVMKPGAKIYIITPYEDAYNDGFQHVDFFDEAKISKILSDAGFKVIDVVHDERVDGHGEKHDRLNCMIEAV